MSQSRHGQTLAGALLTDEHLIAIGKLTAEWAYTEEAIEHFIWALAKLQNDVGRCITTHLNSIVKRDILTTIINQTQHHDSEAREAFLFVTQEYDRLRKIRNAIIHAWWWDDSVVQGTGERNPYYVYHAARVELVEETRYFTADEIEKAAADAQAVANNIHRYIDIMNGIDPDAEGDDPTPANRSPISR